MTNIHQDVTMRAVAASTLVAAHRRDHQHGAAATPCHPHAVEVVYLGDRAAMVCHDCLRDSGFLPHREAEHRAAEHRRETHGELDPATQPQPRRWAA